jgi:hypothetical protein
MQRSMCKPFSLRQSTMLLLLLLLSTIKFICIKSKVVHNIQGGNY